MHGSASAPSGRLAFLDWFRGAFALLMLEGHTFRALLDPAIQAGSLFRVHEMAHGFTGPAFLFASGAGFSLATFPRWEPYRGWSSRLRKRLKRFAALLAIGYMLHLPYTSLRRTIFESTPEQISSLLSMDVLQCIAVGGLCLQLLLMLLPDGRWFFRVTLGGAMVIGVVTPWVWVSSQNFPLWLGTALSQNWGSYFPLFPFMGFQFAGAAWAYRLVQARQGGAEQQFFRRTCAYSAVLVAAGQVALLLPWGSIYGEFWPAGPTYFLSRLGTLGLLLALFRAAEIHWAPLSARLNLLALVGRESLVAYSAHLILLYGSVLNPESNLLRILGSARTPAEVLLVLLLLAGVTIFLCQYWSHLKKYQHWRAWGLQASLAGYLVYALVTG